MIFVNGLSGPNVCHPHKRDLGLVKWPLVNNCGSGITPLFAALTSCQITISKLGAIMVCFKKKSWFVLSYGNFLTCFQQEASIRDIERSGVEARS